MAYDERLAERIRDLLVGEPNIVEKKMFGGLAFLTSGRMAVVASRQGGIMVRVDPAECERLIARGTARPMEMRGREMHGWLRVDATHVQRRVQLQRWVLRGFEYARTLPPK